MIQFSEKETEAQEHPACYGSAGTPNPEPLTPTLDLIPEFLPASREGRLGVGWVEAAPAQPHSQILESGRKVLVLGGSY